jgi:hypothetical protein
MSSSQTIYFVNQANFANPSARDQFEKSFQAIETVVQSLNVHVANQDSEITEPYAKIAELKDHIVKTALTSTGSDAKIKWSIHNR